MSQLVNKFQKAGSIKKRDSTYEEAFAKESAEDILPKPLSTAKSSSTQTPKSSSTSVKSYNNEDALRLQYLRNGYYSNWEDAYNAYTGKKGSSLSDKRKFKKEWVDKANASARIGKNNYDEFRQNAIQKQFGAEGYESGSKGERNRFDRRFNRQLRNGVYLTPKQSESELETQTQSQLSNQVLYPWYYNMPKVKIRPTLYLSSYHGDPNEKSVGDPKDLDGKSDGKIDYNAAGIKLLGKEYMTPENLTKIQQHLVDNKYDLGTYGSNKDGVDGKYGQKTHDALTKYFDTVGSGEGWKNILKLFDANSRDIDSDDPTNDETLLTEKSDSENLDTQIQNQFNFDNFISEQDLSEDDIISKNGHKYVRFNPKGPGDFYVGDDGNIYSAGMFGALGDITDGNKTLNLDGTYNPTTMMSAAALSALYGKKYKDNYNYLYNLINPVSKNKQGGKMNNIKKFQFGKNLPTAPDAKEAFKGGTYVPGTNEDMIIGPRQNYDKPRIITRKINPNTQDTTYTERPSYIIPEGEMIRTIKRSANSLDEDKSEYDILNRRFNEASSVVNDTIIPTIKIFKKFYQQGGQMQQQDPKQQIMQLVQAAMQGDQQATETINKIMESAKLGDPQAQQLIQLIQQAMQELQGQATMARWGSKLKYIKSLKYAKGGKTCKKCENNFKKKVKFCQTGEIIESNSTNPKYVSSGDYWYEQDGNGIIYNDTYSDVPGTLTREIETGNMIDDPNQKRVFYTIQGYNKTPDEDMKMRRSAKKLRNKSIKDLMGGKDELTNYEKHYNDGQHFTKEDFENEEFLNNLSNVQFDKKHHAEKVRNITHPVLSKKIKNGHLKWDKEKYYVNIPTIDANYFCGDTDISFGSRLGTIGGFKWIDPTYSSARANTQENIEYGQIPEMKTQYAVPIPVKTETFIQEEPVIKSIPVSTSVNIKTTPQKPSLRQKSQTNSNSNSNSSSSSSSKPKPKQKPKSESKIITSPKTESDSIKTRTGVRLIAPDGTILGDTKYTDWVEKGK